MTRLIRTVFLALSLSAFIFPAMSAQSELTHDIFINEVMQSTFGGEFDMLMEYPDGWVELYNPNLRIVQLEGYRIGKKGKFSKCYELPKVTLQPRSHIVIYCDKEDTLVTDNGKVVEIHTDFKLTTDTESDVFLFDRNENLVDSVHLPAVFLPGVAIGRLSDGADSLGLEMKITRGKSNEGGHGKAVLPYPVLNESSYISNSVPGQVGLSLIVKHVGKRKQTTSDGQALTAAAICHYTLDGSEPTIDSPVLERSNDIGILINQNTYLRTSYFQEGYVTPPSEPHLYLLHGRDIKLPVVALALDRRDLDDPEYGIFENQPKKVDNDDYQGKDPAYAHNWRRPAVLNYFDRGGGDPRLSQRCELRVGGGYTRLNDMKALILYADDRFATPDCFDFNFWSKTRGGIKSVPSISLRIGGNDYGGSYIRDAVAQLSIGSYTDLDWQGYQPAIYYINDKYQGIINIRERANEDNVWSHNDSLEDITLVEITATDNMGELKKGDYDSYLEFYDFCSKPGQPFDEYERRMDVREYTNMMICHIFYGNTDFPANNMVIWKPNTEDGRWRWIVKDVDRAFNIWNSCPANGEYLKWILNEPSNITFDAEHNAPENTIMFRNLINTVPEYRELFIDQFTVYMSDFLTENNINYWINFCADQIRPEMPYFIRNTGSWENELKNMKKWGADRIPAMYDQLKNRFSLGNLAVVKVNNKVSKQESQYFDIRVNGIKIQDADLNGKLFTGREYVFEGSHSGNKYEITGWTVTETKGGSTRTWTEMGSQFSYTPAGNVTEFTVNAIRGVSGVEDHESDFMEPIRIIYYNTAGQQGNEPFPGLNIVRYIYPDGRSSSEKVLFE